MAQADYVPAKMLEIPGSELVEGEEYYVDHQELVSRWPSNAVWNWKTIEKLSAIYNGHVTVNLGNFRVTKTFLGDAIVGRNYHRSLTYGPPPENIWENFRTRFYRKTDTLKNQEKRDNLQKKEALAATYEGNRWNKENPGWRYHWYKDNEKPGWKYDWYYNEKPGWTYNEGLGIHQHVGKDGQLQFARDPDGKSYLGGGGSGRGTAPLNPKRDAAQRVQKRDARGRTNARKQEERRDRKKHLQIHDNITTIMYFYNPTN